LTIDIIAHQPTPHQSDRIAIIFRMLTRTGDDTAMALAAWSQSNMADNVVNSCLRDTNNSGRRDEINNLTGRGESERAS